VQPSNAYQISISSITNGHTQGNLENGDVITFSVTPVTPFELGTSPSTFTVIVSGLAPNPNNNNLSHGAIAGILLGSVAGIMILGGVGYYISERIDKKYLLNKKNKK